jgi:predicted DNA-binding transcriptional regulator AlpA
MMNGQAVSTATRARTSRTTDLRPLAAHFDLLPNDATVPVKVFAAVTNEGVSTLWAKAKRNPKHPQPIRLGAKCTRFRVGDIRAYLAGRGAA